MRPRANTGNLRRHTAQASPITVYPHVSTYNSSQLELDLHSPSRKVYDDGRGPVAVFSDSDQVGGQVKLDSTSHHTGKLTLSIEGAFFCRLPGRDTMGTNSTLPPNKLHKHVFLSSTSVINISPSEPSSFRQAFVRRRPSISSISSKESSSPAVATVERTHAFTFDLPRGLRPGEEMPATFLSSKDSSSVDYFDVTYKVIAHWEPNDPLEVSSHLEVPFMVQPDADFQSADVSASADKSWLEMPLKSDRPIPVRCAMTLPTSVTFSRSSSIPYFVVFTTTPRSADLAKEIAADATVSVSLIRQITISEQVSLPPTPPLTPTSSEDADISSLSKSRLLRRVAKSQPKFARPIWPSEGSISFSREKPLPDVPLSPSTTVSRRDLRTIHHDMSIGFPKRPRQLGEEKGHPSLETIAALPDGLHKTRIPLNLDMLPCIDWGGISVKYYLDVAVIIGANDFRARIPIRVY